MEVATRDIKPKTATRKDAQSNPEGEACLRVFGQYRQKLLHYLRRRCRSAEDAKDLLQEIYLRLSKVKNVDAIKQPSSYAFRTAVNVLFDYREKNRASEHLVFSSYKATKAAENIEDENGSAEDLYQELEKTRLILAIARQELTPKEYEVYVLIVRDGIKDKEVASRLKIGASTVRTHLSRATLRLMDRLSAIGFEY